MDVQRLRITQRIALYGRAVFCVLFVIEVYGGNARQIVLDRIDSETYFFERILLLKTGFVFQTS